MKKKVLTVLIGLTIILTLVFGLLPSCKAEEPEAPTPGVTPTVKPGETPKFTPSPVGEGEVFKWRFQSTSTAGASSAWCDVQVAENILIASNGRLELEHMYVGSIVGLMEMFEAVSTGAFEVGGS
jgi:hypothetical protein